MLGLTWLPTVSWWWVALGWLLLVIPSAGWLVTALGARLLLRGVGPGDYPRGGKVHLRLWLAERLADEMGADQLAGAALDAVLRPAARCARWARTSTCTAIPPVTGMLDARRRLLDRAGGRPQRPLAGRRRAAHRRGSTVGARRPHRCAQHAVRRAPTSASGAEIAPGVGGLRRGAGGRVLVGRAGPRVGDRPRARGRSGPSNRAGLDGGVRRDAAALIAALPLLATLARAAVALARRSRTHGSARRGRVARPSSWLLPATVVGSWSWPCLVWADRPVARRSGWRPATTPSTAGEPGRRGRPCACWTRRAPGCSRCTRAR